MVPHSSFRSIEEVKPLTIRKKKPSKLVSSDVEEFLAGGSNITGRATSTGSRQPPLSNLEPIEEAPLSPKKYSSGGSQSKKWSWFKHRSQGSDNPPVLPPKDIHPIIPSGSTIVHKPITLEPASPPPAVNSERVSTRKTSIERFGGAFLKKLMTKKPNKNTQDFVAGMLIPAIYDHVTDRISEKADEPPKTSLKDHHQLNCLGLTDSESSFEADDPRSAFRSKRRSLANHNWFARVFQLKPATQVIALNTSKAKGRKELYKLLREWRDYGMEDVYLDKSNSIVHGRVCEANCEFDRLNYAANHTYPNAVLHLREVEFTAEFYTVLEHGRRANLSLVRFKQERGAASSFNKVVETVHSTLKRRGMVVEDPSRAKKMSRVLDSVPNHK